MTRRNEIECPFEVPNVKCVRCGSPYNVYQGTQTLDEKTALTMFSIVQIPKNVSYFIVGGACDKCGYTVGKVLK